MRITKIRCRMPDYRKIVEIFKKSFPKAEQVPIWLLRIASHRKNIYSLAFFDNNELCGFTYFFVDAETLFILYLAVNQDIRSKGYGSRILSWIRKRFAEKTIFLNVEKPDGNAENNEQRIKRIAFYEKNGIYQTGNSFLDGGIEYEILSTNPSFSDKAAGKAYKNYFRIFNN